MLKILILQRLYNLSDDAMEYQMIDRISFRRFLKIDDKVPDAKTIWNFRNQLSKSNRGNWLFSAFQEKRLLARRPVNILRPFLQKTYFSLKVVGQEPPSKKALDKVAFLQSKGVVGYNKKKN